MTGRQHLAFGLITAATATVLLNLPGSENPAAFIGLAALGSLAPDLDHPQSLISKILPPASFIVRRILGSGKAGINVHRHQTHDALLWAVIGIISIMICPVTCGFFFGYWGHLLLDSMTVEGVPWMYGFHKKEYKRNLLNGTIHVLPTFLRVRSESFGATFMMIFATIAFGYVALHF